MNSAVQTAVERFRESAFTAGAMHRLFVVVGSKAIRIEIQEALKKVEFDLKNGAMNPLGLYPTPFLQHKGAHFNRALFWMDDFDLTAQRLGPEFYRRLEFEHRQLTRTATWTLLWVESLDTALSFRAAAPGVWNLASNLVVFPDPRVLQAATLGAISSEAAISCALGSFPIPTEIQRMPLDTVMRERENLKARFWGDLLRLSPGDLFLTAQAAVSSKKEVGAEIFWALEMLAAQFGMEEVLKTCREKLAPVRERLECVAALSLPEDQEVLRKTWRDVRSFGDWVRKGEVAVRLADAYSSDGETDTALSLLDELLDGPDGFMTLGANLLADRPVRMRAMLRRAQGKISEAAGDLDRWEEIAKSSGLRGLIAAAIEARALHVEEMGDEAQAESLREKAEALRN